MKKILILGLFAFASIAKAANFESQSFLAVQAVYATNTVQITNLASFGSVGTNLAGTTYTNNGSRVVVTAAGAGSGVNLLKDVSLWALSDGSPATSIFTATNGAAFPAGAFYELGHATISVTMSGASGANAAVTFSLVPLWDGVNQANTAADFFNFSFTAVASSTRTFSTNVPMSRFVGAKKLRLVSISNADTDATSQVIVTAASLNGFVP